MGSNLADFSDSGLFYLSQTDISRKKGLRKSFEMPCCFDKTVFEFGDRWCKLASANSRTASPGFTDCPHRYQTSSVMMVNTVTSHNTRRDTALFVIA